MPNCKHKFVDKLRHDYTIENERVILIGIGECENCEKTLHSRIDITDPIDNEITECIINWKWDINKKAIRTLTEAKKFFDKSTKYKYMVIRVNEDQDEIHKIAFFIEKVDLALADNEKLIDIQAVETTNTDPRIIRILINQAVEWKYYSELNHRNERG